MLKVKFPVDINVSDLSYSQVPREGICFNGNQKWQFLPNGSLNNFNFWQICFNFDQIVMHMGSGQLFLMDGPTVIVARRGYFYCLFCWNVAPNKIQGHFLPLFRTVFYTGSLSFARVIGQNSELDKNLGKVRLKFCWVRSIFWLKRKGTRY